MLITEYRIVLPMHVDEYKAAQLYSVAEASKNETGGGEGIEVVANEPFTKGPEKPLLGGRTEGQYTHKVYHLASRVPGYVRMLAPAGALDMTEVAWNAYPYCRTVITNPDYMKENFFISIETMHLGDRGQTENAHELNAEKLKKRDVIYIDIANDPIPRKDYKQEWDPKLFKSQKTGRGPLTTKDWTQTVDPVMCAYKLVTCEFKWWGLQKRVEQMIIGAERRIFFNFHRQVFCWTDKWYGLTMEDIRELEERTKHELDEQRRTGQVRGTAGEE